MDSHITKPSCMDGRYLNSIGLNNMVSFVLFLYLVIFKDYLWR